MNSFRKNLWGSLVFCLAACLSAQTTFAASPSLPTLRFPIGTSLDNFDPTEAEDFITVRILLNLGRGLTMANKNLRPIMALAKNYKISRDGRIYTFKLKNAQWSDGKPLTAQDFIMGFERTFSPQTKAKISQNLQESVVGAKDYKLGKISDFSNVGVKATDNHTLVFTLIKPTGYFLSLLALPFSFPQREKGPIKVGSPTIGPYFISELKSSTQIFLSPNENYKPKALNQVQLKVISEGAAALSLYEKKELDVLEKVPSSDFDRFKNDPDLVASPFLATYYLGFNISKKPFDNLNVRKTIFSSIQRNDLKKILKDPQIISSSLVPTPLPGSDHKFPVTVSDAQKKDALKILKSDPQTAQGIELAIDAQEKNVLISSLIQQQLKTELDLPVKIKSMEWKSYISYLTHDRPSFFRFAWLAAFPDPLSHLNVFTSNNPNNYTSYANPDYDKLVEKVAETSPSVMRTSYITQAQKILIERDAVIMPLYHYKNYYLISSRWQGIEATPMGILYFDRASPRHEHGSTP